MISPRYGAAIARWMSALIVILVIPLTVNAREGDVKIFKLPNGLTLLVLEDHARKVAALQLWAKVGSADEVIAEGGISHLIEHMAFKGTKRRGVGQIAAEVEALGGDINAYTSWDETVFHITVPSTATIQGLDILTDAVFRPEIDAQELDKEKQVVLEEILEGEERPSRKASKLLFEAAYVKGRYKYPVIGYKAVVERFTRDDILAFRKKWYKPENMFLLVVGDVNADQVRDEVLRLTADIKPTGFFSPPRPEEPAQTEIRSSLVRDKNSREARLLLGFHITALKDVDTNALDLAADILGARESSRLVRVLKKDKKLVHGISLSSITPKDPGLMAVSATLDTKNLEAATRAVMEELAKLGKEPPSAEELERARTHIEADHIYSQETVQGKARTIGNYMADLNDARYGEKYLKLNELVTPAQVSDVVRSYLVPPNVTVTVLAPEGDSQETRIESLVQIVKSFGAEEKAPAVAEAGKPSVLTQTLPNGIKVVLQSDRSNPVVSFRIAHLGGKRFETKEEEGITNFVASMLNKGTPSLSEVEISRKVEDMGGKLSGFSGYDSFGVSASFFSRYLGEGLKLLADISANVSFPEDKFEREKTLILNQIKTEPDRPVTYSVNVLNRTIFPQHPYGFDKEGTLTTITAIKRDDLKRFYERYAVPANTVISVVGDIDAAKVMQQITDLFGKLPARQFARPEVPAEDPLNEIRNKEVRIPRAKVHLVIGFRGTTMFDAERYPLEVLSNVLAGQGGWLFLELRDKQSLAYTVTAFSRASIDPGTFIFYIACDPSKAERAVQELQRVIGLVREKTVDPAELKRSIENLTGTHLIGLQRSSSRAENMALNTLYGLGYDYDETYLKKIGEVTSDGVLKAARKFLDPKRCVIVKIVPEEHEK